MSNPVAEVPQPELENNRRGSAPLLILVSAPSGAGKTTLCQQVLASRPEIQRAITCTTRQPRPGERDGIDYYFLDVPRFMDGVKKGQFLEHATVYGNCYGTLKTEVLSKLREGVDVLLNVDVQGAASIRARAADDPEIKRALITVFLTPPSMSILEKRLRNRGSEAPPVIERRLGVAREELSHWVHFDYLLLSGTVGQDLQRMLGIIDAEKSRTGRAKPPEF